MEISDEAQHAISGGVAGAVALLLFYPLDVARTMIQVSKVKNPPTTRQVLEQLVKKHGWKSMYDGAGPNIITMFVSQYIYFYIYNALKQRYLNMSRLNSMDPITSIGVATAAGVVNVLATAPLWVASTRMKMQRDKKETTKYKTIFDAIYRIATEESIGELWNGTAASIVLVSNPVIHFVTYEQTISFASRVIFHESAGKFLKKDSLRLPSYAYFLIAAWSKFVTTWSTYPLQVLQNRLRARKRNLKKDDNKTSDTSTLNVTIDEIKTIFAEGGIPGFYRGIQTKLLQTVLTAAFMFATYEKLHEALKTVLAVKKK